MDPIADMIVIIKNALANKQKETVTTASVFKKQILSIMKDEKYIDDFEEKKTDNKKFLVIRLRYNGKTPAIKYFKKISKPGLRIYSNYLNIPRPLGGLGMVILSTPQGVLTGPLARKKKIGGEIICEIH